MAKLTTEEFIKERFIQDRTEIKKEQPVITVLSQMSVDLIRSCQVMSTRVSRECLWRKS